LQGPFLRMMWARTVRTRRERERESGDDAEMTVYRRTNSREIRGQNHVLFRIIRGEIYKIQLLHQQVRYEAIIKHKLKQMKKLKQT